MNQNGWICDNGSMDSTWLPGVPYLVQIQKGELWLLQQPPLSNQATDILGNTDSRSHLKYPQSEILAAKPHSTGDGRRAKGTPLLYIETSTGLISPLEKAEGMSHGNNHIDYQSVAKYNATYKSDILTVNTPGVGTNNGFLLSVVQRTMRSLAVCTQRSGRAG